MYTPPNPDKMPQMYFPCPGNDENNLSPGMHGIKDVANGGELWYKPFKNLVGDAEPTPVLVATAANIATNAGNIATNTTNIATNTSDIAALIPDPEFEDVPWEQVVTNGNFDTDVTSWTVGNSATVTWQSGGIARIAYNSVTNPYISQVALEIGVEYVFAGRARGDGTNFPTLEASGVVWTALDATEWQEFIIIFTATSTSLQLTSGGATSGYVEWDYQYARSFSNIPVTDKTATWITRENLYVYPLDLSNAAWQKVGCTVDGSTGVSSPYIDPVLGQVDFDGFIADVGTGNHYLARTISASGDEVSFSCIARPGNYDFFVVDNTSISGKRLYCNLTTLEVGALPSGVTVKLSKTCCGGTLIQATLPSVVGNNAIAFGPRSTILGANVNGDGSTINVYITRMQLSNGAKESNVGFYNGGASAYPRTLSLEYPDDYQLKHANGKALTADGAWVYLSDVTGIPMDESPSNVWAMKDYGLVKNLSNGTWSTSNDSIEYILRGTTEVPDEVGNDSAILYLYPGDTSQVITMEPGYSSVVFIELQASIRGTGAMALMHCWVGWGEDNMSVPTWETKTNDITSAIITIDETPTVYVNSTTKNLEITVRHNNLSAPGSATNADWTARITGILNANVGTPMVC